MSLIKKICFIIMPFSPELHYFYLYLKQYVENHYGIRCERADAKFLTVPFLNKIKDYIRNADVIIADCSGRNPNVFYELGIAHAYEKKVILITKDSLHEAPSDVRHYEFIHYELDKHSEFFERLDNALHNIFFTRYEGLFQCADKFYNEFEQETNFQVERVTEEIFLSRVMAAERKQDLPPMDDDIAVKEFVLPKIITNSDDVNVMNKITDWIYKK